MDVESLLGELFKIFVRDAVDGLCLGMVHENWVVWTRVRLAFILVLSVVPVVHFRLLLFGIRFRDDFVVLEPTLEQVFLSEITSFLAYGEAEVLGQLGVVSCGSRVS